MGALALVAEYRMTFGDWLKETRTAKGIKQQQLADAAGCKVQYISRIENNVDIGKDGTPSRPKVTFVDAWAKVLGVPINEARSKAGHPEVTTSREDEDRLILNYIHDASEPSREIMRAVLKTIYEVDRRRVATAEEVSYEQASSEGELVAGDWPTEKDSKKKGSKNAKRG